MHEIGYAPVPAELSGHKLHRTRNFNPFEDFNLIAHFDIIVVSDANAAFSARLDFINVILEPPQGIQFPFMDHHVIPEYTDRIITFYNTAGHDTTGDLTEFWRPEYFLDFRQADDLFADFRFQHATEQTPDVIDDIIDDAVIA